MAVIQPNEDSSVSGAPIPVLRLPYPHRSIRAVRLTLGQLLTGLGLALFITACIVAGAPALMDAHGRICVWLLALAGVPVEGREPFHIFEPLDGAWAPVVPFLPYTGHEWLIVALCAASVSALLLIHRRVMLARNFLAFLMSLLILPAAFILLGGRFEFDSGAFTRIWIRFESVIWLLLPWVSVSRLFPIQRSKLAATLLLLLVQGYGFLWSAVRLAFCLGLFHYTGVLFLLVTWFCLGLLGDVLYIIVFYSLAIHMACIGLWGERASWQH